MRVLITKPFWLADSPQWRFRLSLFRYLSHAGYKPVLEPVDEAYDWAEYDAVFVSPYVVDKSNYYCMHIVRQMQLSLSTEQQRWVMDDDEHYIGTSILDQSDTPAALYDKPEYTHRLRLPHQPAKQWPGSSLSGEVMYGDWYRYPDFELVLHAKSILKQHTSAKYFGNLKQDRIDRLNVYGIACVKCDSYTDYLASASASTALVMLSSPGHNGSVTVRLAETMLLSIAVFHSSYFAIGFTPRSDRVFDTPAELAAIMAELHSQTPAERQAELMLQLQTLRGFVYV